MKVVYVAVNFGAFQYEIKNLFFVFIYSMKEINNISFNSIYKTRVDLS